MTSKRNDEEVMLRDRLRLALDACLWIAVTRMPGVNNGLAMLADALPGVNRIRAVQRALDGRVKPVYLEIGVSQGFAFRRISADVKIAVDPAFKLSAHSRRLADAKARVTHYFETTSDDFFDERGGLPRAAPH